MSTSSRYGEALNWAEQLHRHQSRHGKAVPFLSHVISVSALVWEDGGNEDQAIAGLLHATIDDAGQSQASIRERFGNIVATIVGDCTDPGKAPGGATPAPWIQRKQRFIATLQQLSDASLLVTAADKAHNCRDRWLDVVTDPASWNLFSPGFDGSAWYFWSLHKQLHGLLPGSRSVKLLGDAVRDMLSCPQLLARSPRRERLEDWVSTYLERPETHPAT